MPTTDEAEFVSLDEAASLLGVHEVTVRVMIREGKLQAEKVVTDRKRWKVRRDSIGVPGGPRPPKPPSSPLDLAIDRYELARSRSGAARTGSPEYLRAAAERDASMNALMALLRKHGKQHQRGGVTYQSDGEELYRFETLLQRDIL